MALALDTGVDIDLAAVERVAWRRETVEFSSGARDQMAAARCDCCRLPGLCALRDRLNGGHGRERFRSETMAAQNDSRDSW
jgi:hypothetical protein